MRGIPVHLNATTVLTGGTGATAVADLGQMQMQYRTPIEVDEIRITIKSAQLGLRDASGIVGVQLDAGPYRLTSGIVPVWSLAPYYNNRFRLAYYPAQAGPIVHTRWVLPRPMVLPSGFVLRPQFTKLPEWANTGGAELANLTIDTAIVGRALIDGKYPRASMFPYVSTWIGRDGARQSDEIDLRNDLDKTIRVHRFIGRMSNSTFDGNNEAGIVAASRTPAVLNKFTIKTSYGYNVTTEPTPFFMLFPAQVGALPVELDLKRNEAFTILTDTAVAGYTSRPHVGFVATREEAI